MLKSGQNFGQLCLPESEIFSFFKWTVQNKDATFDPLPFSAGFPHSAPPSGPNEEVAFLLTRLILGFNFCFLNNITAEGVFDRDVLYIKYVETETSACNGGTVDG